MKQGLRLFSHRRCTSSRGYTLIELLVVVAIISILAGLGFAALTPVIRSARIAKTENLMHAIQTGVNHYMMEYNGRVPVPASSHNQDVVYGETTPNNQLAIALNGNRSPWTGNPATSSIPNERELKFLDLHRSDLLNDYMVSPFTSLADQNDRHIRIAVDGDYSRNVQVPDTSAASGMRSQSGHVAIWSKIDAPADQTQWKVVP